MTKRSDPSRDDEDNRASHEQRIEWLVEAALKEGTGRLRFEDELARGGMGAVRQAFDASLQRRMAVKTLHAQTYDHVMLVHGFLREAQVTGQLDHPNIVPIHELGRDEHGELYFTMKLVDGESLKAVIRGRPPAGFDQLRKLLEVFVKVCDALAFAHHRGVLHCDIKSANVMVGKFGQVYLMDWGGAQLLPRSPDVDTSQWVRDSLPPLPAADTVGMVFGTPAYMSPEQASAGREPMDERSDVFSMGALLYEMMTGRPPYHGGTPMEGVVRARLGEVATPPEMPQLYPGELIRIVMRALTRDPDDRYQNIETLQTAIVGLLTSGGSFPAVHYAQGEHVIREGEVGDAAYWIESGTLEVYKLRDGQPTPMRVLMPGAIFGETAIFARSLRTASVVALEDVSMRKMTAEVLERELAAMTPWMRAAISTLARRFSEVDAELRGRSSGSSDAPPRLAAKRRDDESRDEVEATEQVYLDQGESVMVDIDDLDHDDSGSAAPSVAAVLADSGQSMVASVVFADGGPSMSTSQAIAEVGDSLLSGVEMIEDDDEVVEEDGPLDASASRTEIDMRTQMVSPRARRPRG